MTDKLEESKLDKEDLYVQLATVSKFTKSNGGSKFQKNHSRTKNLFCFKFTYSKALEQATCILFIFSCSLWISFNLNPMFNTCKEKYGRMWSYSNVLLITKRHQKIRPPQEDGCKLCQTNG